MPTKYAGQASKVIRVLKLFSLFLDLKKAPRKAIKKLLALINYLNLSQE